MKRLMFLLIFTAVSVTTLPVIAHAAPVVTDGLVSYWTFDRDDMIDGTVKDVWGENDAMLIGNPTIVNGRVKEALQFDGIDDFVNLTTLGDFGSQLGSSTFEAWVKVGLKEERQALFKIIDSECMGWGIVFNSHIEAHLNDETKPVEQLFKDIKENMSMMYNVRNHYFDQKWGKGCYSRGYGGGRLKRDEKWRHIVFLIEVKDNERVTQFYIDGKQTSVQKVLTERGVYIPFTDPIYLGATSIKGEPRHFFEGAIDEVRIYSRPLTEREVTRNFKSNIGLSVEPTQKLSTVWGALKSKR